MRSHNCGRFHCSPEQRDRPVIAPQHPTPTGGARSRPRLGAKPPPNHLSGQSITRTAADSPAARRRAPKTDQPAAPPEKRWIEAKTWLSSGGLVRLKPFDCCNVTRGDEVEEPPLLVLRRIHNFRFPVRLVFQDRELVADVGLVPLKKDELADKVVQTPPYVVNSLSESKRPLDDGELRSFFEDGGDRLVRSIDLSAVGVSASFNKLPHLLVERVQLVFGAVELGTATV